MTIVTKTSINLSDNERIIFNSFQKMLYDWEEETNRYNYISTGDFSSALSDCINALKILEENINTETETEW